MSASTNPQNLKAAAKLKRLAADLTAIKFDVELIGAKKAEALIKRRIFNEGKDADGGKMETRTKKKRDGYYSAAYAKKRRKLGRQVTKAMDSQLRGDLFQSVQVVVDNGTPVLKITNSKLSEIAGYLEGQQQREIFNLSDTERVQVKNDMRKAIDKITKKYV